MRPSDGGATSSELQRRGPQILVFSSLFPHSGEPYAGVFIRERMFRVGKHLPIVVVAPQAWFPLQGLIRRAYPWYRPNAPKFEIQEGVRIYHPRFIAVPGAFRQLDGVFMALGSLFSVRRIKRRLGLDLIDAHFAYPSGYAATLLGKWFKVPVTITLRGTEAAHLRDKRLA